MGTFDTKTYDNYLAKRQYLDAIAYLKSFKPKDRTAANNIKNEIYNLQETDRIYHERMARATNRQDYINAVNASATFSMLGDGNFKLNPENPYEFKYMQEIYNLSKYGIIEGNPQYQPTIEDISNNKNAVAIKFAGTNYKNTFAGIDWIYKDTRYNQSGIQHLYENTGWNRQFLEEQGATFEQDDQGHWIMYMPANNPFLHNVLSVLDEVRENGTRMYGIAGAVPDSSKDSGYRPVALSTVYHDGIPVTRYYDNIEEAPSLYESIAEDNLRASPGNHFGSKFGGFRWLTVSGTAQDEVRRKIQELDGSNPYDDDDDLDLSSSIVGQYMGAQHEALMTARIRGDITSEQYNAQMDDLKMFYRNELNNLKNGKINKVYRNDPASEDPTTLSTVVTSSQDLERVYQRINNNWSKLGNEDKSMTMRSMQVGDVKGTYFEIPSETYTKSDGTTEHVPALNVFIPNLLMDDEYENQISNDPSMRAYDTLYSMKKYHYDYEIPGLGTVRNMNMNTDTGILVDAQGRTRQITAEEVQEALTRHMKLEDDAWNISQNWFNAEGERDESPENIETMRQAAKNVAMERALEFNPDIQAAYMQYSAENDEYHLNQYRELYEQKYFEIYTDLLKRLGISIN